MVSSFIMRIISASLIMFDCRVYKLLKINLPSGLNVINSIKAIKETVGG